MPMKYMGHKKCSRKTNFPHPQLLLEYQEPYKNLTIQVGDGKTMARIYEKPKGFRKQ